MRTVLSALLLVLSSAGGALLPAPAPARVDDVCASLARVFGASGSVAWDERRVAAQAAGLAAATASKGLPSRCAGARMRWAQ